MVESLRPQQHRKEDLTGLLFIGDPHVENRQPGFRKDDYPQVILGKLKWCLEYADREKLLPVFLGDLFEKPRENSNWMIVRLMELLLDSGAIGIYGNHDCADPVLSDRDSLAVLVRAGCLELVSAESPWSGEMKGSPVVVGGSSYRQKVPREFDVTPFGQGTLFDDKPLVAWITHHDIEMPGYDAGRFRPRQIKNVQLLVNGHIHRRLEPVQQGQTEWLTPGSISRRSRSEANRHHVPSVLRADVVEGKFETHYVEIPHRPFEEVFHTAVLPSGDGDEPSDFITGLKEMLLRKTESGAGLFRFLEEQLVTFPPPVAEEIMSLAKQVEDE
ncbi:MAG: metallophosphoesterase [Planctomycetota bacterium]|nr:metallophosphoesterase [Planctomycetota bacterium]